MMSLCNKQLTGKSSRNEASSHSNSTTVSSIFISSDDDIAEPELEPKTKNALEQLARNVADFGVQFEEETKNRNKSNPNYWFLYDKNSLAYKYYSDLIEKLRYNKQVPVLLKTANTSVYGKAIPQPASMNDSTKKRKRKSRWDDDKSEAVPPASGFGSQTVNVVASPSTPSNLQNSSSLCIGIDNHNASLSSNQSQSDDIPEDEFKKQILASQLAAKALAKITKSGPPVEYDSDEDTEGGTFEHKRRLFEMQKTYNQAKQLTERSKGKHHLADFLPDEEKEKFFAALAKARKLAGAVEEEDASGTSSSVVLRKEDYADNKLQENNVGFKLLQKMGWSTGKGLGANEQGIQTPVNKGRAPSDTQGLGADDGEPKEDDNIFDMYRKRMMLAYKFRPNPLNNPRRPYY